MTLRMQTISHHEALIFVMVMLSAADRAMPDRELRTIGDLVKRQPIFADFPSDRLLTVAQDFGARMQAPNGLQSVLDLIADTLPPMLYDTAYALAVEVAAADLAVGEEETRLLHLLRNRLNLDTLTVGAIEASARARFRRF